MISFCLCRNGKKSSFEKFISYEKGSNFEQFNGTVIGKCTNCELLKTFSSGSVNKFNPRQSRGEFYDNSEEKFIELFKPIVNLIKKHKKRGIIIDVGCSSGILLLLLKEEGFNVMGIEPNKNAFEKARKKLGKKVYHGTLQRFIKNKRTKFDCIIYNHVIEHIENPIAEISLAKKILKKDGLLIVGVPNTDNVIFFLRQKYWESLMPNEHIWHFSEKYLENLFNELSFKIVEKIFTDDKRQDYPLFKRIYFKILSIFNRILNTGEAVLFIIKK